MMGESSRNMSKDSHGLSVSFELAGPEDAHDISSMSLDIWSRYYSPDILTADEVIFFWDRAYSPARLRDDMASGTDYQWIKVDSKRVGFLALALDADQKKLYLSKLYLAPEYHGLGIGSSVLAKIQERGRTAGVREIYLYVFRRNIRAVHAYLNAGFVVSREEVTECAEGFSYDDYVMVFDYENAKLE